MDIIDIYTINGTTYADLNPSPWIEFQDHEIASKFFPEPPPNLKVYRTTTYNVAIYLTFSHQENQEEVNFNKKVYKRKVHKSGPAPLSQLCLVFKNEWSRIPNFINFYKRVHGVDRFLLYDNNSDDPPPEELLNRVDVIYIPWFIPYKHILSDKSKLAADYDGPEEIISGQNSAYSHALKKYQDAKWTLFLDTDEFVVRRTGNPSIKMILESTETTTDTLIIRGFWAGCNKFQNHEIYENLRRISKRGRAHCMNKLFLRTDKHQFTDCIHRAYPTEGKSIMLGYEKGIYFFHLHMLSVKRSGTKCVCSKFCCHPDRSFIESWFY